MILLHCGKTLGWEDREGQTLGKPLEGGTLVSPSLIPLLQPWGLWHL